MPCQHATECAKYIKLERTFKLFELCGGNIKRGKFKIQDDVDMYRNLCLGNGKNPEGKECRAYLT